MAWVQRRQSGKYRGVYRDAEGKQKAGPTMQYRYQAMEWAEAQEDALAAGNVIVETPELIEPATAPDVLTVAAFAAKWIETRTSIAANTRASYRRAATRISDDLGATPLAEVDRAAVLRWLAAMDADRNVGPVARNYALKVLRMMFQSARFDYTPALVASNPTEGIKRVASNLKPRRRFMSADDVDALLEAAANVSWINSPTGGRRVTPPPSNMLRLAILLGVDAGLRWEEIAALDLNSVYVIGSETTLYIHRSSDRKGRVLPTTKNHKSRDVPVMTERLRKALSIRMREARLEHGANSLLIYRADGSAVRYEHWQRVLLKGAIQAAGIHPEPTGWHDLRHTFGSTLAEAGVPTKVISTLMGHSEEDVTQLYMHDSSMGVLRRELGRAIGDR